MNSSTTSRRRFLKQLAVGSAVLMAGRTGGRAAEAADLPLGGADPVAPNSRIGVAALGMGSIGFANMGAAVELPGVEFVAAADCYDGRLVHTNEVFGDRVETSRDYRAILARDDVDAVFVNTPDHWHARMAIDAMEAGKAVHVEKPMVQQVDEGRRIVDARRRTGAVVQVGSEGFRSPLYRKARELIADGAIGEVNMVEGVVSRNFSIGAWNYAIPPDASPETIDWSSFLGHAPDRPFSAERFFRWRKYWDYGTGIPGDMFVHRFSALHYMLRSAGPTEVFASGGIRYWNDGREVPDVVHGIYEYPATERHPAFTLQMMGNFADGSGGGPIYRFMGGEGLLEIGDGELRLSRLASPAPPSADEIRQGYGSVRTFAQEQQDEYVEQVMAYRSPSRSREIRLGESRTFSAPEGFSSLHDHLGTFFDAIRGEAEIVQDPTFGLRAAAPALLANRSYREGGRLQWDPVELRVT